MIYDVDMETQHHLEEVNKCKVFVGHKTHSTIFALATGTPVIALAYHPKTIEFLKQFGLEKNAIDDKYLSTENLCNIFENMEPELDKLSLIEYNKSIEFANRIEKDFFNVINRLKK